MRTPIKPPPGYNWGNRTDPVITHGNWSATPELAWRGKVLYQKFKRRVKRDWGRGCMSRSMEYQWMPVPVEGK